jgi:hypothetical protein
MPVHIITLIPNDKGWELNVSHAGVGLRQQIDCPHDEPEAARAIARDRLGGVDIDWVEHQPHTGAVLYDWGFKTSYFAANPEVHSFDRKGRK